jgi:hypothetical protein
VEKIIDKNRLGHDQSYNPVRETFKFAKAALFPALLLSYSSGFWQSKNRHGNQTQALDVRQEHVRRGLLLTVLSLIIYIGRTLSIGNSGPVSRWCDPCLLFSKFAKRNSSGLARSRGHG